MTLINSRMVRGRCPVCGGGHAACGPPSVSVPVDENWEVAAVGGPLKKYEVVLPGGRKTVMKLNEADAERYGAIPASPPAETETDKAETTTETAAKSRAARNKSRTATNKDGGTGGGDD